MNITIALCVFGWCWYARLAQEQAQDILDGEVVAVARVAGVSGWHQVSGHVLPHVARRLLVVACLDVGYVILMMSALGYLGLGAQEPQPELGQMLRDGQTFVLDAPWLIIAPVLAIVLVVLPFSAAGERVQSRLARS
jgi:peptide/nickel transport system permease protein